MEKPRAILFEYLDKHEISYDTHYIDDSDVAFDAIEEAMEAYAKYYHEQKVKSVDLADVGGNEVEFYCMEKTDLRDICKEGCEKLCKKSKVR